MKWIVVLENVVKVNLFVKKMLMRLENCFHNIQSLGIRREKMFPCHHLLATHTFYEKSSKIFSTWETVVQIGIG